MATEQIFKLAPHRSMYLRGFDRRGSAASMNNASATGLTISGVWSDQADFAVPVLFDADDFYGHLYTTKYLPDFSLTNATLDFDLATTGLQHPLSSKYPSVPWNALSYITATGMPGTVALLGSITSATGGAVATLPITITGTVTLNDLFYIIYLGNYQTLYQAPALATPSSVASGLTVAMNTNAPSGLSLTPFAVWNGTTGLTVYAGRSATAAQFTLAGSALTIDTAAQLLTGFWGVQVGDAVMFSNGSAQEHHTVAAITTPWSLTLDSAVSLSSPTLAMWPMYSSDGNSVQLEVLTSSTTATITPAPSPKLTGGTDPSSVHVHLDFSLLGIASLRQAWFTLAPALQYDSGAVNPALVPYVSTEFSAVFTNWATTDTSGVLPLKIAGPGSVTVDSQNAWAVYAGTSWVQQAGFYLAGFSEISANPSDKVTVTYSCQFTHNLYLGTTLQPSAGIYSVTVDGITQADLDCYLDVSTPLNTRRIIATGVAAGTHSVVLTIKATHNSASSGFNSVFDYLQAAVLSDVQAPTAVYTSTGAACDYDTGQTYQIPPSRALDIMTRAGLTGDIDFYAGVFFALKRIRVGGNFHQATITLGGALVSSDSAFVTISGTALGVGVTSVDTLTTIAQRFVNAINTTFVGVSAAPATAGVFTITSLSPINGFTLVVTPGTSLTVALVGDINAGNEGTWGVDDSQTSPINRAFSDYLTDFAALVAATGQTMTVAFSQELLAPPDANTAGGAWSQRFSNGVTVLTDTAFGSWGAGVVDGVSGSGPQTVQQIGHGYITGNTVHVAQGANGAVWAITVTDADHYQLTTLFSGVSFTVAAGATTLIDLQTSQCAFNPSTVTPYLAACYTQVANILDGAGLAPWLQFGEILHWFFSQTESTPIGFVAFTSPISIGMANPHGMSTGQTTIIAGVQGNTAANGTHVITVTDATHFTLNGTSGNGAWVTDTGTASFGGMAYYDANQNAAAVTALGRALTPYWTQDDTPVTADVTFLSGRIKAHIDAIRTAVLAAQPTAKFELLYPTDVTFSPCYYTANLPYPQGGNLNNVVNLPTAYRTKSGSGLDRLKIEALSWGETYRNLTNALLAVQFAGTAPMSWAAADTVYLVPWDNGGCPWPADYLQAAQMLTNICFWAIDHLILMSWPIPPLPAQQSAVSVV